MDKQKEIISVIEQLFPPGYLNGSDLLLESILESDWRTLPESILVIYRKKCMDQDFQNTKHLLKQSK